MSHFPQRVCAVFSFNCGISGVMALPLSAPGRRKSFWAPSPPRQRERGLSSVQFQGFQTDIALSFKYPLRGWGGGGKSPIGILRLARTQMSALLLTACLAQTPRIPQDGALFQGDISVTQAPSPLEEQMQLALAHLFRAHPFAATMPQPPPPPPSGCISAADSYCRVAP